MRTAGRAAVAAIIALQAGAVPAGAAEVGLTLQVTGAVETTATAAHRTDGGHFCSAAPDPWVAPDAIDPRASPYPFYRVVFGQTAPEEEPDAPGPSLGLALSNYFAAARDHGGGSSDSIELVIKGRHFVGHAGLGDPDYRLVVSFRTDREGGGFVAHHLHESGTGDGVIDVAGNWHCPAVAADQPVRQVREHKLFDGAVPVVAEATHLRLTHTDAPCRGRTCAGWQVIDQGTGEAFMARVDFRRLKLARGLRRQAEHGTVVLLVDGDVRPGEPPRVVPRLLAGVEPVPQADPEPSATAEQQVAGPGPMMR
jgi:hypothetical protein